MTRWKLIEEFKDGTVRYFNPFAGSEAWYTPGRRHRPLHTNVGTKISPLILQEPQNYCAFCSAHYNQTTPEKSRYSVVNGLWQMQNRLTPSKVFSSTTPMRRIGNLYEIFAYDYWHKNYGLTLTKQEFEHQQNYLSDPAGQAHIVSLLNEKHSGKNDFSVSTIDGRKLQDESAFLFGGSHELIVPGRHYVDGAVDSSQLCSTGALTPDEHFYYFKMSIHAATEIYRNNPFVKFVCLYTNWLRDAGASFEHLHRQVLGIDRLSEEVERGAELQAATLDIYERYVAALAYDYNFVLCDNPFALAVADIGRPFPTIAVYSKSRHVRPDEHSSQEIRGMSDIVHAVHAAFGAEKSVNEEWYYSAPGEEMTTPWYILIKWRNHRLAGIEGIMEVFPNEFSPMDVKEMLVDQLVQKRENGEIAKIDIGEECRRQSPVLTYWK